MNNKNNKTSINSGNILSDNKLYVMPCCYDALSAKMIEKNDFKLSFMSDLILPHQN